jgi:hypothetical protein
MYLGADTWLKAHDSGRYHEGNEQVERKYSADAAEP